MDGIQTACLMKGLLLASALALTACAHRPGADPMSLQRGVPGDIAAASSSSSAALVLPPWMQTDAWQHHSFPGKRHTLYVAQKFQGREALMAQANSSMSVVRKKRRIAAQDLGHLKFSWAAQELMLNADIAQRDTEDAKLRVVLMFEGDRSRFSPKNQMLSDLSQALTGEELPYATLMYVWSNQHAVDSIVHNPRTDRIRKLVLESGGTHLGQWREYERDIAADFERVFGEKPGALISVALMTDSDNTQSRIKAWYGSLQFAPLKQ